MSYWNQHKPYGVDKAIVAFADDISTPHSLTVTSDYLGIDADGRKALTAGHFVARVGSNYRFLPRATVSTAFSTGAATGNVSSPANVFIPGDVLYIVHPYASITFASTWAINDTVTITVNGISLTVTAASATLATIATAVAAAINASAQLGSIVQAFATGAQVFIYAANGRSLYSISSAESTVGTGTAAVDNSATALAFNNTAIGTVSVVNPSTGLITLTGNAGINVPVGARIGVKVNEVLGVYPHSIDFTDQPRKEIAPVKQARGVYIGALPYYDTALAEDLPGIVFAEKF